MSKDALSHSSQPTEITDARIPQDNGRGSNSPALHRYLVDALENIFEQGDKLRFSKFGTQSVFLPSCATVMQFLGWTNPSLKMLSFIEDSSGVPLKMSRTARYDLFNQKGVAERAGYEVLNWLTTSTKPFFKLSNLNIQFDIDRAGNVGSNSGDWLTGIAGYKAKAKLKYHDNYFEFVPLITYLEQRCSEDVSFLESAKAKVKQQKIDINRPDTYWQLQLPLWQKSSLVEETILNEFLAHLKNIASKERYSNSQKLAFISCYLPIYFDFYFGAFASFEVGCVLYYHGEHESLESKKGILNRAITSYAANPKIKSCLEALLIEIRDVIPNQECKMTWTDLAAFIPVNVDENELPYSATTLKRKKVDRLKSWRNKKDLPTNDLFRRFLSNLYESFGEQDTTALGDLFVIAIGIDRYVIQLSKQVECEGISKSEIEAAVRAVLSDYDKYYLHMLRQYL